MTKIIEILTVAVGAFGIGFLFAIAQDLYESRPAYQAERRKQIQDWVYGFRKTFPVILLIVLALTGSAYAEEKTKEQYQQEAVAGGYAIDYNGEILGSPEVIQARTHRIENTVVHADGSQEWFPQGREKALQEQREHAEAVKAIRTQVKEFVKFGESDTKEDKEKAQDVIKEVERKEKEDVEQNAKREKEIKDDPVYEYKALVSFETQKN